MKKISQDPGQNHILYSVNCFQYKEIMLYNGIINNIANQYDEYIM